MPPLIEMQHITKRYTRGKQAVCALNDVSFSVQSGEMLGILGRSGSGKSTLMQLLGCLDFPTSGQYAFNGTGTATLSPRARADLRSREIGFVFQSFYLLPTLSALENVELPLLYRGVPAAQRRERARQALDAVGLTARATHRPNELSGGQQQRVAVARAMVTRPALLLADEPTGNLDAVAGRTVMELLREWNAAGHTVLLITHDREIAGSLPRCLHLKDGLLQA